jgi:hypothetical protein
MGIKYLSEDLISTSASEADLYEVPAATTALLSSLRVTNANSMSAEITVNLYPAGGSTAHALLRTYSLPVRGTMDVFSGISCVLQAGDILKVEASEDDIVFHLSYMEVDRS